MRIKNLIPGKYNIIFFILHITIRDYIRAAFISSWTPDHYVAVQISNFLMITMDILVSVDIRTVYMYFRNTSLKIKSSILLY